LELCNHKLLFAANEYATMNHLSMLVTDSARLTVDDRVDSLVKLHHVLEMTTMLKQQLDLPHRLLCTAARSRLLTSSVGSRTASFK